MNIDFDKGDLIFLTERGIHSLGIREVKTRTSNADNTVYSYIFPDQIFVVNNVLTRPKNLDINTGLLALTKPLLTQVRKDDNVYWAIYFAVLLDSKLWVLIIHMRDPHHSEKYISFQPGISNG